MIFPTRNLECPQTAMNLKRIGLAMLRYERTFAGVFERSFFQKVQLGYKGNKIEHAESILATDDPERTDTKRANMKYHDRAKQLMGIIRRRHTRTGKPVPASEVARLAGISDQFCAITLIRMRSDYPELKARAYRGGGYWVEDTTD